MMLLGFLFVRPVPLLEQGSSQPGDGDEVRLGEPTLSPGLQHRNHSRTSLLNDDSIRDRYVHTDNGEYSNSVGGATEATRCAVQKHSTTLNVHGKALLSNLDSWLLLSISSMRMFPFSNFLFV